MSSPTDGSRKRRRPTKSRGVSGDAELLSQRVFAHLERAIIRRIHPPGTHLVEEEVAAEMGVSRMPVREAFRMLQREGWLEIQPYMGAHVRQPALNEVRDVFELRHRLGAFAAQLASDRATGEEIDTLKRVVVNGRTAAEASDIDALAELNWEFHRTLAKASRNELLTREIEELDKRVRWHFAATTNSRAKESWGEHEAIVDALVAHDAELAGRLTFEHSRRSEAAFLREQFSAIPIDEIGSAASNALPPLPA
jgi:DNA-binding GntR family transcriptional regulator